MQKVHPYHHMRPRRIEIAPRKPLSYSVNRHAEDQDIRYGFGHCGKTDNNHVQVAEIDYAWLGVVFHVVVTSDQPGSPFAALDKDKDNTESIKQSTQKIIVQFLLDNPDTMPNVLATIHEASREQGHLEVIKHTVSAMKVKLDFKDL